MSVKKTTTSPVQNKPKPKPKPQTKPQQKPSNTQKPQGGKVNGSQKPQSSNPPKTSGTAPRDVATIGKPEEPPRSGFVNPLNNLESGEQKPETGKGTEAAEQGKSGTAEPQAKPGESGAGTQETKKPEEGKKAPAETAKEDAKPGEGGKAEGTDKPKEGAKAAEGTDKPKEGDKALEGTDKPKEGDKAAEGTDKPKEGDKANTSGLPEGFTLERAQQTMQQIQNFANLATHLPDILAMGDEIKKGGIQAKHTEALKAAFEPLKGVLTPENIQAFKNMDVDQVNKMFSPENLQALRAISPELADKLNPEKIKQLTEGMKRAQGMLDKDKLAQGMNMMAPFVNTSAGPGALNVVAGMVDDPNQLGGADRKLSLTDIPQVTNGLLNTGPVRGMVNGKIAEGINHAVHYRQDGSRRGRVGEALVGWATSRPKIRGKIYNEAWSQVRGRAPGEVTKQASPYLSRNGDQRDYNTPRHFADSQISYLMGVGQQVQGMRGQNFSTGNQQIDNANQAMAGVTGILHKSVIGDDGMVSGDELRNVSGFGSQLYNYMGLLYTGVGGHY